MKRLLTFTRGLIRVACATWFTVGTPTFASTAWKNLAEGLDYTSIPTAFTSARDGVHAFRINLKYYRLSLLTADKLHQVSLFADQMATQKDVLIAINGGFFTPDMKPLGLRVNDGNLISSLKTTPWWGVLTIEGNRANIVSQNRFRFSPRMGFAIQAGPRLIVNGQITNLRGGLANRSALGLTRRGELLIVITDKTPLTTTELATLMKKPESANGLDCYNALNLDGGTSSQLYAHIGDFSLHIPSLRPVSDLIYVAKK